MRSGGLVCLFFCTMAWAASRTAASHFAPAGRFDTDGYQAADGSISLLYYGSYVEPYFATKALLVAQDAGLDVRQPARRWIQWLLPRQDSHGSFGRYCRKPGQEWRLCAPADADDSMLALWLQLLYTNVPESGLPAEWQKSAEKARSGLDSLRNSRLGVYHVSRHNHVALLMDNAEVYSALMSLARSEERLGQGRQAETDRRQAETLDFSIERVFRNKREQWFRPSIQKSRPEFYPDVVAQVYPWLADMPMESSAQTRAVWLNWKRRFADDWLERKFDPHPWGLVALAALKLGDRESAACWLLRSQSLRFGRDWNVLEEAAYQAIYARLDEAERADPSACSRMETVQ